jgi:hypothetical protein
VAAIPDRRRHHRGDEREALYDVIWAMIVVIAMPVANAKAKAIATNIFFMEIPRFPKASVSERHQPGH